MESLVRDDISHYMVAPPTRGGNHHGWRGVLPFGEERNGGVRGWGDKNKERQFIFVDAFSLVISVCEFDE